MKNILLVTSVHTCRLLFPDSECSAHHQTVIISHGEPYAQTKQLITHTELFH